MFFLKRKRQKKKEPTWEEKWAMVQEEFQKDLRLIENKYEDHLRILKDTYEKKNDKERAFEEFMGIKEIILEAEKGEHPLEYSIKGSGKYGKTVFLVRAKQSPNPYEIEVDEHTNCIFLNVRKKGTERGKEFIVLYYDKIKKKYSEYKWSLDCDYMAKHQLRSFLYDVMKHVKDDTLYRYPFYISEYRASEIFWKKQHVWKEEYEKEKLVIEKEKEKKNDERIEKFKQEKLPFETLIKEKEKQEEITKNQIRNLNEQNIEVVIKTNDTVIKEEAVYDKEVAKKMKEVFHQVYEIMLKRHLLDIQYSYEVETLYERDMNEVWKSYVQLSIEKQKKEKDRFLRLLVAIEKKLSFFEERIQKLDEHDYERKMKFMERKYLNGEGH